MQNTSSKINQTCIRSVGDAMIKSKGTKINSITKEGIISTKSTVVEKAGQVSFNGYSRLFNLGTSEECEKHMWKVQIAIITNKLGELHSE